jgi:hypothetical protein
MVKDSAGRAAALPNSAGSGTTRPDGERVVRVPLCAGTFELRVHRKAVNAKRPPQDHIEGLNADATPC